MSSTDQVNVSIFISNFDTFGRCVEVIIMCSAPWVLEEMP